MRLRRIGCHISHTLHHTSSYELPRCNANASIRCAPRSYLHSYLTRRPSTPIDTDIECESTIGSHAGKSKHTEMQFYRPTPSGRRRRLGAPWLPLRTSPRCLPPKRDSTLRCLPPKRDFIRCGAYAPKRYEIRCGVSHQSSAALYAEVLANQGYELCCGV